MVFNYEKYSPLQVIFLLYGLTSYMVYISPYEVPTAIQGGVYVIGVDGHGDFSQHEWHHNLHIGSSSF